MADPREARFRAALEEFERANSEDPNMVVIDGIERPREVVQAERYARWVGRLDSAASEALRLAAHCQHLRRWEVPRTSYPEGRTGYLLWRSELAKFHAEKAAEILRAVGYEQSVIGEVTRINLKRGLRTNPDTQSMEDALCLSFLENEIEDFAAKHDDTKLLGIVRKTWRKMSDNAHSIARELPMSSRVSDLVARAIAAEDA